MGSKKNRSTALLLVLNLVFFTLSSACDICPTPKPKPPKPQPEPSSPPPPPPPSPPPPCPPPPRAAPPSPPPPARPCPRDALKFGVCNDMLAGMINYTIGTPPKTPCCTFMEGLADFEAAICLCTAIKANVLGMKVNIPISLTFLLNVCSKTVPPEFQCA